MTLLVEVDTFGSWLEEAACDVALEALELYEEGRVFVGPWVKGARPGWGTVQHSERFAELVTRFRAALAEVLADDVGS